MSENEKLQAILEDDIRLSRYPQGFFAGMVGLQPFIRALWSFAIWLRVSGCGA